MLCTFATAAGAQIIRAEDIRALTDTPPRPQDDGPQCELTWLIGTEIHHTRILGTATANLERITAEEKARIEEAQRLQNRLQRSTPVARGRA